MLREPRRLIASVVAIAAGVAFVAATLILSASLEATLNRSFVGQASGSAVIVQPRAGAAQSNGDGEGGTSIISAEVAAAIDKAPGVTGSRRVVAAILPEQRGGGRQLWSGRLTPTLTQTTTLVEGRLPAAAGEVAVTEFAAKNRKTTVGATIALAHPTEEGRTVQAKVVGIVQPGPEITDQADLPILFASYADLTAWRGYEGYDSVYVSAADPVAARDAIRALPQVRDAAQPVDVETTADHLAKTRKEMAEIVRYVTGFLLAFGIVALVVSALVIANTFSILVAQRTRQLALLRCVGATKGQVFRTVTGEALLMGLVGGVVGLLGGAGLVAGLYAISQATDFKLTDFVVTPAAVLVPVAMALVVTLLASVLPARRATRVMPLAALRPNLAPVTGTRAGRLVLTLGALFVAVGGACLWYGATKPGLTGDGSVTYLLVGIAGGLLSFAGVLMLGTVIIPALTRVVGVVPARLGGVPGRLAAENSRRNPSRAAATCSALLIGVTLITTVAVGAQSGLATQTATYDRLFPFDLAVQPQAGTVPDALVAETKKNPSVVATARGSQTTLTVAGAERTVVAYGADMRQVVRNRALVDHLADDTILLPTDAKVADGSQVTVTGPKGTVTLRAVIRPKVVAAAVTPATLDRVTDERTESLWLRLKDGAKASEVVEQLSQSLSAWTVNVTGGAIAREGLDQVVLVVVGVVAGLLAVSVLIALVGITNTLGLSVLERTQESGLLRALGLTAGRLRWMFALEAVMLAAVAVVLGLGLGLLYGVAGTYALLRGTVAVVLEVPWTILGIIAAVAVVAGLVASVVPAVRAGRIKPAAALAVGE